jgi:hypothetical protein
MATYLEIYQRSQDGNINAQIAVAICKEAKYILGTSVEADAMAWATFAVGNERIEARKYQVVICSDPAIADAVTVSDENIQAAVTPLVPTMIRAYDASLAVAARQALR